MADLINFSPKVDHLSNKHKKLTEYAKVDALVLCFKSVLIAAAPVVLERYARGCIPASSDQLYSTFRRQNYKIEHKEEVGNVFIMTLS